MASAYDLSPELEARLQEAEKGIKTFSYRKPDGFGADKARVMLGKGGNIRGVVQMVREGGENNLHYHTEADTLWMVLKGRVKFYGCGDKLLGEFGPHEGIITPAYSRYWFESSGDDDLELLQVGAFAPHATSTGRIDVSSQRFKIAAAERYVEAQGEFSRETDR
jgi:mannose-6-phosphate isomerase-like protein (cupin superfamily)